QGGVSAQGREREVLVAQVQLRHLRHASGRGLQLGADAGTSGEHESSGKEQRAKRHWNLRGSLNSTGVPSPRARNCAAPRSRVHGKVWAATSRSRKCATRAGRTAVAAVAGPGMPLRVARLTTRRRRRKVRAPDARGSNG